MKSGCLSFLFLSFIDLVLFARTCKKFNSLINSSGFIKRAERHLADVFVVPMEQMFIEPFIDDFSGFFKKHWKDIDNVFYLKYFLCICKKSMIGVGWDRFFIRQNKTEIAFGNFCNVWECISLNLIYLRIK